jgi:hypothetical protein
MPELAMQKSAAGAKAFVSHYIESINYAWAVGDAGQLRPLADQSCRECLAVADAVDDFSANGGYQHGGEWIVKRLFNVPTEPAGRPVVSATIEVQPGEWRRRATAPLHRIEKATRVTDFSLSWTGTEWAVQDIGQS